MVSTRSAPSGSPKEDNSRKRIFVEISSKHKMKGKEIATGCKRQKRSSESGEDNIDYGMDGPSFTLLTPTPTPPKSSESPIEPLKSLRQTRLSSRQEVSPTESVKSFRQTGMSSKQEVSPSKSNKFIRQTRMMSKEFPIFSEKLPASPIISKKSDRKGQSRQLPNLSDPIPASSSNSEKVSTPTTQSQKSIRLKRRSSKQPRLSTKQKTETSTKSKGSKVEAIQYRSNLLAIARLLEKINLSNAHKEELKKTPFGGIFNAFMSGMVTKQMVRKSDQRLRAIIKTFNPRKQAFKIGKVYIPITKEDLSLIFGIPIGPKKLELGYGNKPSSPFVNRRFGNVEGVNTTKINEALQVAIRGKKKEDIHDVAALLSMYLFSSLFFPSSCHSVNWSLVIYLQDVNKMSDYNWPTPILEALTSSISINCEKTPEKVTGFAHLLLYWFCEHTTVVKAQNENQIPRFVKWNLSELHKFMDKISIEAILPTEVVKGPLKASSEELKLLSISENVEEEDVERPTAEPEEEKEKEVDEEEAGQPGKYSSTGQHLDDLTENMGGAYESDHHFTQQEFNSLVDYRAKAEKYRTKVEETIRKLKEENSKLKKTNKKLSAKLSNEKAKFEEQLLKQMNDWKNVKQEVVVDGIPTDNMFVGESSRLDKFVEEQLVLTPKGKELEGLKMVSFDSSKKTNSMFRKIKDKARKPTKFEGFVCDPPKKLTRASKGKATDDTSGESPINVDLNPTPATPKQRLMELSFPIKNPVVQWLPRKVISTLTSIFKTEGPRSKIFKNMDELDVGLQDIQILINGAALNDKIIDAYSYVLDHEQKVKQALSRLSSSQVPFGERDYFFSCFAWPTVRNTMDSRKKLIDDVLPNLLGKKYLFFPMISGKNSLDATPFHWTLLVLNVEEGQWLHFNSMLPRESIKNHYIEEASKLKKYVEDVLHTHFLNQDEKLMTLKQCGLVKNQFKCELKQVLNCPQQKSGTLDCGVVICYIMKKLSERKSIIENFEEDLLDFFRSLIIKQLLCCGREIDEL